MSVTKYIAIGFQLDKLRWSGDNRVFVVEELLPCMNLRPETRQVIRWAYGYDGERKSYEHESDGSSVVPDRFMMGLIKEPVGVGHDYLNRVMRHTTPDGHRWTMNETCLWYAHGCIDFNYPVVLAWTRYTGLWFSSPCWWR